jgi:ankyrin repeat protein
MSAKKKSLKGSKDAFEKFPPPEIDVLTLDDNYLFNCSLKNNYQEVCGAFDAKEHQLATFVIERDLFNKRDGYGRTVFDLAAYVGNKEFIKAILDRSNDKIDENVFNLKHQLRHSNPYNFMHLACIWGREDLVRFLVENQKQLMDPSLEHNELSSVSTATMQSARSALNVNPNLKTLGSILLRTKTKAGESPKDLAIRYDHKSLVDYLNYAGL